MEQTTTEKVISISEYAQVRGCSVAAVYKRLDGTLKPFVKVINNKKYLTSDVLDLEGIQPVEKGLKEGLKGFNPGLKAQEHPGNQEADAREQTPPAPAVGVLEALEALERQLKIAGCEDRKELEFQKALLNGELPYTIGGGIGQSRICMFYLRKAHIGEIQASIWPEEVHEIARNAGIPLL